MGLQSFDVYTPVFGVQSFLNADTPGIGKVVVSQQPANALIGFIAIANNDTIAHNVTISIVIGANAYPLGSVAVPAGSGYLGVPSVDALHALFPNGTPNLPFPSTATINAYHEEAVTAPKVVRITVLAALVG